MLCFDPDKRRWHVSGGTWQNFVPGVRTAFTSPSLELLWSAMKDIHEDLEEEAI